MKFKILPKVDGFMHEGVRYKPGDTVELPARYRGLNWLEPLEPAPAVVPKVALEPAETAAPAPLEAPAETKRSTRKKSKS